MQNEIENHILKSERKEREVSDDKYAPMIVKTILFYIIGTLSAGIIIAIGNAVFSSLINHL